MNTFLFKPLFDKISPHIHSSTLPRNWQKMTAAEKGRFCNACQKVVVDFTKLSDAEIINYFAGTNGKTCGRFTSGQLSRSIETEKPYNSSFNYRFFTTVSLLLGLSMPLAAHNAAKDNMVTETIAGGNPVIENKTIKPGTDNKIILRGQVRDSVAHEGLVGATVIIKGTRFKTNTDINGNFEFKLPGNYRDSIFLVKIKYLGYITKIITHVKPSETPFLSISLEEAILVLAGEVIIIKQTPWKKFKNRIKGFFRKIF